MDINARKRVKQLAKRIRPEEDLRELSLRGVMDK
jgi:hypothetical protein